MGQATILAAAVVLLSEPSYVAARGGAAVVSNLGRFLESYVGDCDRDDPSFDRRSCETAAASYREKNAGKLIRFEIEDLGEMLQFAGWDDRRGAYRLHLTPFFGERGLAITVGRPEGVSSGGPIVKNVPIWVKRPPNEEDINFKRRLERGLVRLEVVARPKKPWALKSKDGKEIFRGVDVTLVGLRLLEDRGDKVLAEQSYP